MANNNTVRGIYSDLRKMFDIQFQEFIRQFLSNANVDLDAFFDDVDANQDFLESIISQWCENVEPSIKEDLDCSTAVFLQAFLEKLDKETAANDEEDKQVVDSPLG